MYERKSKGPIGPFVFLSYLHVLKTKMLRQLRTILELTIDYRYAFSHLMHCPLMQ